VLHHLDLRIAGRELRRVLRPGGVAVFCEPWGENPLLRFGPPLASYSGKERTRDEEPLCRAGVEALRESFTRLDVRGFQLLSMVRTRGADCSACAGLTGSIGGSSPLARRWKTGAAMLS